MILGVIAMKTLAGAKEINLKTKGDYFAHAAFKWTLKHEEIDGLVVTINNSGELDHYVRASNQPFESPDLAILEEYKRKYFASYCRTGCGECLEGCPKKVNIPTILRHQMYFQDYGMEKRAMGGYAHLAHKADICFSCKDLQCEKRCPYGLPIASMLKKAHENLVFQTG